MRKRDTLDVMFSAGAIAADALAIYGGFMLATWIRFDSGWMPQRHATPERLYHTYGVGAIVATIVLLLVFRFMGLFVRPQTGRFSSKIPRIVRATGLGILLTVVVAFSLQNEVRVEYSRLVIGTAFFTIVFLALLERYGLYRIEWNVARHSKEFNRVLVIGTDEVAVRLSHTLKREPMLRARVGGFLQTDTGATHPDIPPDQLLAPETDLATVLAEKRFDQVILSSSDLGRQYTVDLILLCERNLVTFNMVPDLFRIMTSSMDVQSLSDIPLLGISRWPLDCFWNRVLKRAEDIIGAAVGLLVSAPVLLLAAVVIKRTSPGPVLYKQERCGERGRTFPLYKLRTMHVDAESTTGPVFTAEDDPRRTRAGSLMRHYNIDELPQLWNVLCGDMSLVGPRPERPHFVEKFKTDISRYMWRHVSKPGLTGWAQVNGLRGNTSIEERIKYDLYYLENWSLAFDFKILVSTLFAHENAY